MFQKTSDVHIQNSFVNPAKILSGFLLSHTSLHLLQNGTLISAGCYGCTIRQACTFFPDLFVYDRPRCFLLWCLHQHSVHSQERRREPASTAEAISMQQRTEMLRNPSMLPATPHTRVASRHVTWHANNASHLAEEGLLTLVFCGSKS